MTSSPLQGLHQQLGARFTTVNGASLVADYGDGHAEYTALRTTAGVLDLSARSRLCLAGPDRARFLHGQVTNDVGNLKPGEGCYAALVTAKGKMESDIYIHCLSEELLLDFEPGLTSNITRRLEKYIVADDVQVLDAAAHYGLLSVQGPRAAEILARLSGFPALPQHPLASIHVAEPQLGDVYLMNHPRLPGTGFDLFAPNASLGELASGLLAAARTVGACACGWTAMETVRIEAGIPRYGADMDASNLPLECGIESRAVSYRKGCYIGQEVINRIHSIGHVNRELRGLRLDDDLAELPARGDPLFLDDREVGYITSATKSPALAANLALGYVRRESGQTGTVLQLRSNGRESRAQIVELPHRLVGQPANLRPPQ